MKKDGGGWTVIQRRRVGLTSFDRDWKQYKNGFGTIRGDFWLGNEHIFRMTRQPTVLRIELEVRLLFKKKQKGVACFVTWQTDGTMFAKSLFG